MSRKIEAAFNRWLVLLVILEYSQQLFRLIKKIHVLIALIKRGCGSDSGSVYSFEIYKT